MEKIKLQNFVEVLRQGFSLNNVYLLESLKKEEDPFNSLQFPVGESVIQGMVRKGLCNSSGQLLPAGEKLLELAYSSIEIKVERIDQATKKQAIKDFDLWWTMFPGTDTFEHKGVKFQGTRALRTKKEDCKMFFEKILREGFTASELVGALAYEVEQKKEESVKRRENKIKFMQNSLTYLRQRTWEPYVELLRAGGKVEVERDIKATTDI